jgi:hypothetical protein
VDPRLIPLVLLCACFEGLAFRVIAADQLSDHSPMSEFRCCLRGGSTIAWPEFAMGA